MHWKVGTSRVVLVVPALGICLKFARIQLLGAIGGTWDHATMRPGGRFSFSLALAYWKYSIKSGYGARIQLFRGLRDNVREWWYSVRRPHPVIARTYLTLGFVNVQERVEEGRGDRRAEVALRIIAGPEIVLSDQHAFDPKNFGVRAGKAVVLDYGSLAMQKVLDLHADRIHNEIDLVSPS